MKAMTSSPAPTPVQAPSFKILYAVGLSHFLNDTIQSLILAIYPILKAGLDLSFSQIGIITLTFQCTSSLLQPLVGVYTDRHPKPYSLALGMCCTLMGLLLLSVASTFPTVLVAASMIGMGSSILHPEATRVARMASGGRYGLAQSIFQVGGNAGSAMGPLLAAWIVLPYGQRSIAVFSLIALLAVIVLIGIGRWYKQRLRQPAKTPQSSHPGLAQRQVVKTLVALLVLMFSKAVYQAGITSYLIFYLMHRFSINAQAAQYHLFYFLASMAVGTLFGGPISDRIGRKRVIWFSVLGAAPFTLALPYVSLELSTIFIMIIGFMIASAFPVILVYAQGLFPAKVGTISGLFFGFSFGLGGIGAAVLGHLADLWGIITVYKVCAFLPLLGLVAIFLPSTSHSTSSTNPTGTAKAG